MFKTANRRGTCVPATIIVCLDPGTLMAELVGPGTAFRCVPSYFNPPVAQVHPDEHRVSTIRKSKVKVNKEQLAFQDSS